jgi:NAD(P)-dependent dehydrogenase (short-subunit alcohol dehydrogenase family)
MTQDQPKPPYPEQHQSPPGIEERLEPEPQYQAPLYKGANKLEGKVALITGGDSGIGRAVAVLFAREGANVAITYLPEEQVDAEVTEAAVKEEGKRALLLAGDITDPAFAEQTVQKVMDTFGQLDILVNNAAYQQHVKAVEDLTFEQWDHTFKTNIYGYFRMVKAALPHLKAGSAIINTGSITGLEGSAGLLDYSTTKGAIHALPRRWRKCWLIATFASTASRPARCGHRSTHPTNRRTRSRTSARVSRWDVRHSRRNSHRPMSSSLRQQIRATSLARS